jgi:GDP-L-fucose synthase
MAWQKRVLVTGASGFLGQHLCRQLALRGAEVRGVSSADGDLRDPLAARRLVAAVKPEMIIHAAVVGGGIDWMRRHPVAACRDNSLMSLHLMDAAAEAEVERFVGISSACAYPGQAPVPTAEDVLYAGAPEATNAAYAEAKRLMMRMGEAHAAQGQFSVVFPLLANLYGPGDSTDPARAHVVAGLVLRCLDGPDSLQVWGTGKATRELLYIEDAADGVLAAASSAHQGPINIGTGREVSIRDLAQGVAEACRFAGPLHFDSTQPDGQLRKCLDVGLAVRVLGWSAQTPLTEGLAQTVSWYRGRS